MTPTDQTFETAKPGYYIYDTVEHVRHCSLCNKTFKTNLGHNRFCSHAHKERLLEELTGRKK